MEEQTTVTQEITIEEQEEQATISLTSSKNYLTSTSRWYIQEEDRVNEIIRAELMNPDEIIRESSRMMVLDAKTLTTALKVSFTLTISLPSSTPT